MLQKNDIDAEQVKDEVTELIQNGEYDGLEDIPSVPDELALSGDGEGAATKGVTVYRDGSRSGQVKTTDATQEEDDETESIEAQTLIDLYEDDELTDTAMAELVEDHDIDLDDTDHQICPDCGDGVIRRQEGCNLCPVCGYSNC